MVSWSGFWNHTYSDGYRPVGRAQAVRRLVGRALHGYGRKPYNAVLRAFVTGDVGATAAKDYTRVAVQNTAVGPMAVGLQLGGKRAYETKVAINRAITAADQTIVLDDLDFDNSPEPWPVDKSGNGGGGKGDY